MPRKHEKDENAANPPGVRSPKLRIAIPLSASASTEVKTKAAVYRGQLTQEQFLGLLGSEIEQHLPRILRQIVSRLEGERRQRLGLDIQEIAPVAIEAERVEDPEDRRNIG